MENQNVPVEMWNINQHRHRTNYAVVGWNSKLNSTTGKQQPNVFSAGTELKRRSRFGILAIYIKGTCTA
jgi:hypothetical protein